MNNLCKKLAPISDAAWAQIEEEAAAHLQTPPRPAACGECAGAGRHCSFRDRHGPLTYDCPSEGGRPRSTARREVKALVEFACSVRT